MNPMLWLITGLAAAWLGCLWQTTVSRQRLFINAMFGIVGAVIGGLCVAPSEAWFDAGVHWPGLAGAAFGAAFFVWIADLRARRLRRHD